VISILTCRINDKGLDKDGFIGEKLCQDPTELQNLLLHTESNDDTF